MKTYSIPVLAVTRETSDTVKLTLDNSKHKLTYKPGQFITIIINLNGKEERRSYSLCSSPHLDEHLEIAIKSVKDGYVSKYLNTEPLLHKNLDIIEPMGQFVYEPANKKTNYILIGAGSGITPLISIIKSILHKDLLSTVTLIYGSRHESSIIFNNLLQDLARLHPSRFTYIPVISQPELSWDKEKGRITPDLIDKYVRNMPLRDSVIYLCGPKELMERASDYFEKQQVPKNQILKEAFHAEAVSLSNTQKEFSAAKVTIKDGNKTYQFEVDAGRTILETGLKLGFKLPYSCQSGMCTACMGKCTFGKVLMDNPDGLTDGEISKGYVLTCCGRPGSPEIVIEL